MASDYIETKHTQKPIAERIKRIQQKLDNLPDDDSLYEHGYLDAAKEHYEIWLAILEDMVDTMPQYLSNNNGGN